MATAYEALVESLNAIGKADKLEIAWSWISSSQDVEEACSRFSAEHHNIIRKVFEMREAEWEAEWKLQESINAQIAENTTYWDDEVLNEVDAYAIVYNNRIEVTANVTGMGNRLPKQNRKYIGSQGDMRWQFPLSSLSQIRPCVSFVLNEDGSLNK